MKTFFAASAALLLTTSASALPSRPSPAFSLSKEMVAFQYSTFDSGATLACTHSLFNANSQDWIVNCSDAHGQNHHQYLVHLWLSMYTHPVAPRVSYELIYWVTDRSSLTASPSSGSTIWFHFDQASGLKTVEAAQSVENDAAGLYLTVRADALKKQ